MFQDFDEDGSGSVDKSEMLNFLKKLLGKKTFNKLGGTKGAVNSDSIQLEDDDSENGGMAMAFGDAMIASVRSLQAMGNEEAARKEQEQARLEEEEDQRLEDEERAENDRL